MRFGGAAVPDGGFRLYVMEISGIVKASEWSQALVEEGDRLELEVVWSLSVDGRRPGDGRADEKDVKIHALHRTIQDHNRPCIAHRSLLLVSFPHLLSPAMPVFVR